MKRALFMAKKYYAQWILGISITFTLIVLQFYWISPSSQQGDLIKKIEGLAYDTRLKLTTGMIPAHRRSSKLVNIFIIDIDEKSIQELGRFPWSRNIVAQLHTTLVEAGAAVIAYDVLFSEKESNPAYQLATQFDQNKTVQNALNAIAPEIDADTHLASSIGQSDTVLGILFEKNENLRVGELPDTVFTSSQDLRSSPVQAFNGYLANISQLQRSALGNGFINPDGYIRHAMLMVQHNDEMYPALSLEAARLYTFSDKVTIEANNQNDFLTIKGIRLGKELIPTDEFGRVAIPYRGPKGSFEYFSAVDVFNKKLDMSIFDQSVVFVGTSAVTHADLRNTPVGIQYPGVEVHANVFEGLVFPELLPNRPDWIDGSIALLILIVGLFNTFLLPNLRAVGILVLPIFMLSSFVLVSSYAWIYWRIDVPQIAFLALTPVQVFLIGGVNFFKEYKTRIKIKSIFDQYVPPEHIQTMIDATGEIGMEGERRNMTVLFADVRDFTTISESLTAEELKSFLNQYLSPITQIIFEHEGTIDKYVGDMVMAFWNAPIMVQDHAQLSVKCAMRMIEKINDLQDEMALNNLPNFKVGIGLNTGDMNVGDMGSEYRKAYTVLGDSVNLGSRLEGLTKYYGVDILISEFTFKACPDFICRPIDKIKVKGKNEAVTVYEPITTLDNQELCDNAELEKHNQAWKLYLEQSFEQSLYLFEALKASNPDRLVYGIFCNRLTELIQGGPIAHWDGSYTHKSK